MVTELKKNFPNLSENQIWKLLLTIKARYKTYTVIGISRLEAIRYWMSERQLQSFINFLRESKALNKIRMIKCKKNAFKCNVYRLSEWFIEWLNEIKDFVKKTFTYIDPTNYVKSRFSYKIKYWKIKFKVNWNRYIIHQKWRFKNVIYDVWNNCIISPLLLE